MHQFLVVTHSDRTFNIAVTDTPNYDEGAIIELADDVFVSGKEGGLLAAFIEVSSYCREHKIVEMNIRVVNKP